MTKGKKIRIICLLLSIAMMVVSRQNVYGISGAYDSMDVQFDGEAFDLIKKSIQYLNEQDYQAYVDCFCDTEKSILKEMLSPYYIKNNIGYLNVKKISLISVNKTDEFETICDENISEYDSVSCYKVSTNVSTYQDDIFYYDGNRTDIYCIGIKNNNYEILSITSNNNCFEDVETMGEDNATALVDNEKCNLIPKTIKVKYLEEEIIKTVDFKEYVQKVSVEEVGYEERATGKDASAGLEWQKACVLAVKTYALYYYHSCDPNKGYHLDDKQQIYKDSADINTCPSVKKAINLTWNYVIYDYNMNIVEAEYRSGNKPEHYEFKKQYSGKLHQLDAWKMAKDGKTYQQILSFYYSKKNHHISISSSIKHEWIYKNGMPVCKKCGKKDESHTVLKHTLIF